MIIADLIKEAAHRCGWAFDVKILVLAGFLSESEAGDIADAAVEFQKKAHLADFLIVGLLCEAVQASPKHAQFPEYLANVVETFQAATSPVAAATVDSGSRELTWPLTPQQVVQIQKVLAAGDKPLVAELGHVVFRSRVVCGDLTFCLDVVNAEWGPALDLYATRAGRTVASLPVATTLTKEYCFEITGTPPYRLFVPGL